MALPKRYVYRASVNSMIARVACGGTYTWLSLWRGISSVRPVIRSVFLPFLVPSLLVGNCQL